MSDDLDPQHHIFRYVGGSRIDGDSIDASAFWRVVKDGKLESGLSVNWVEWFRKPIPKEAVEPLREVFLKKGRTIGSTSRFALLNVGAAKAVAAKCADISVVLDSQPDDESHSLIMGYEEVLNEQVAEQLVKAVIETYPGRKAHPRKTAR